ncbi:MAG TPA: nitroreductase family deazaflavin-dependent oxidoreductase [Pseudonocardiaceae bacterium]|nr:nitroreductase family deazaflavin-dependent oxidoreductase [Pseudonocardiaceae bacterium]
MPSKFQNTMVRQYMKIAVSLYKVSGGSIGGKMRGAPVLLLTTSGRKTGNPYTNPLIYGKDGDRFVVIASYGGAPQHPGWWRNLLKTPKATVQVGKESFTVTASEATGEERDRLWTLMTGLYADYDAYQKKTDRQIPVVILERT